MGVIATVVALTGCGVTDLFPGNDPLPDEVLLELSVQQASLSPFLGPLPDTVNAERSDGDPVAIYAGDLQLVFLPMVGDLRSRSEGDYFYAFSRQGDLDGDFDLLTTPRFNSSGDPDVVLVPLYRSLLSGGMEAIPDVAEQYLSDAPVIIPAAATHVELRFLPASTSDYELVARWPLTSFIAWQRYIEPLIPRS